MNAAFKTPKPSEIGNVIIADDDEKTCLKLKQQFEDLGYGVYICQTLADFMEVDHDFLKCVILDINLDNNEAFQVIQMIRQSNHESNVPVLLTSNIPSTSLVIKGLNAGADDYILKPFSQRELMARVNAVMRSRGFI